MKLRRMNGFSLIELMVAVAIIGILAAIALPSYSNYIVKASRETAQAELLELAGTQEKIYLNSNAYTSKVTDAYTGKTDTDATNPGGLGRTSGTTTDGKYTITLDIVEPAQTFKLMAKPVAGKKQEGNGCITIDQSGKREWHDGYDNCDAPAPKAW